MGTTNNPQSVTLRFVLGIKGVFYPIVLRIFVCYDVVADKGTRKLGIVLSPPTTSEFLLTQSYIYEVYTAVIHCTR